MPDKKVETKARLDAEFRRQVDHAAVDRGVSLNTAIEEGLRMWLEGGATTGTRAPDWLEGASTDECQIAQAAINLMRSKNSVLIDILQTLLREYRKKNNNGEHRLKRAQ